MKIKLTSPTLLARASKVKQEKNKSENEMAAKEFEQNIRLIANLHLLLLMKLN